MPDEVLAELSERADALAEQFDQIAVEMDEIENVMYPQGGIYVLSPDPS